MRRPGGEKTHLLFSEAAGHEAISARLPQALKPKREAPFSLRLTQEERKRLQSAAGNLSLSAYIKARLFEGLPAVPRQRTCPQVDRASIGQTLALLGQSRLSSNMNQIAKAANRGTLPLTPEVVEDINAACSDIRAMRQTLVSTLGLKAER